MTSERFQWTDLSEDQAAGRACVICHRPFDLGPPATISVGISAPEMPVRACLHDCATGAVAIILTARDCLPQR